MRKTQRARKLGLVLGLAACALSGCGSSTPPPPLPSAGNLVVFIGDAPFCNVLTMRLNITGLTLTRQGSSDTVSVIQTTPSSAPSIKVNFPQFRDFLTFLNISNVPDGTFDKATITLSTSQLVVTDSSGSTSTLSVNVTNMMPTVSIQPPLTVVKNQANALRIDLDLARSIEVNAQGQVTGNVTPQFKLTPVVASGNQGFGELDDVWGFVRSVTTSSSISSFTGGFVLQLLSDALLNGAGGPAVGVNVTSTTAFSGVDSFGQPIDRLSKLPTGSFVEMNGITDSNGNVVASAVDVEDVEDVGQNKLAFIGTVTSGPASGSFKLFVQETEPNDSFDIPADSIVQVNTSSTSPPTVFKLSSIAPNLPDFANQSALTLDITAITPGQEIVVHGKFDKSNPPSGTVATVAANRVYLKLQPIQGVSPSDVQPQLSDNKTGNFRMGGCSGLLQGAGRIRVFTNGQTTFVNLSGLNALNQPGMSLLVKGLPFFVSRARTVQGVMVPDQTLVILAKQVRQL